MSITNRDENFTYKWFALIGLSLLSFTAFLDFTIVVTALPFIQKELHASILQLQWVSNALAISLCVTMIAAGKLADVLGRRKVFYFGFIIFAIAAVGSGAATTIEWLIAFRALQGVAASIIATSGTALLPEAFPENEQTRALSIFSTFNSTGLALGPFIGGTIISLLSWRWIFWINIPIILVGLALCLFTLKPAPKHPQKIDWIGAILLMLGLGCLVYGTIAGEEYGWTSFITISNLLIGIIASTLLVYVERKIENPLLDLSIFSNKHTALAILACISAGFPAYVFIFFDPLYLHIIRGYDAFFIGLILVMVPIINVLVSLFFEQLERKINVFNLLLFAILSSLAAALLHMFFTQNVSLILILFALAFMGYTWGMCNIGSLAAITRSVKADRVASSVGTVYTFWNVSGSIVLALSSVIFHWQETHAMQSELRTSGLQLSGQELNTVHQALLNPDSADTILKGLPTMDLNVILDIFHRSFIQGYQWVAGFATITVLLIYLAARRLR